MFVCAVECLDELGCLIDANGISVCQPSPAAALKFIAQQIADRDNSVRSAALNTIVVAYHLIGENVFKHIGTVNINIYEYILHIYRNLYLLCFLMGSRSGTTPEIQRFAFG